MFLLENKYFELDMIWNSIIFVWNSVLLKIKTCFSNISYYWCIHTFVLPAPLFWMVWSLDLLEMLVSWVQGKKKRKKKKWCLYNFIHFSNGIDLELVFGEVDIYLFIFNMFKDIRHRNFQQHLISVFFFSVFGWFQYLCCSNLCIFFYFQPKLSSVAQCLAIFSFLRTFSVGFVLFCFWFLPRQCSCLK